MPRLYASLLILAVLAASPALALKVEITQPPNPFIAYTNEQIAFVGVATNEDGKDVTADCLWEWYFGKDEKPLTGNPVAYAFPKAGEATVTATAHLKDDSGACTITGKITEAPPAPKVAPAVALSSRDGNPVCHSSTLRADCGGDFLSAQVKSLQWKKGDDPWKAWDYLSQTGDPGVPVGGWVWNQPGRWFDGGWTTLQGPNVEWQFIVTVRFFRNMPPGWYLDVASNTVGVQVRNTVVTASPAGVLSHHANDTHEIGWDIEHKDLPGIQFAVTINIINTTSGAPVRTQQQTQVETGAGSWTWDGKNAEGGQDVGGGIYAYKVSASDPMCTDQDKSGALTVTVDGFYRYNQTSTGQVTVLAKCTLSEAAAPSSVVFYGPDLAELGSANVPTGAGAQWSEQAPVEYLDQNGQPISPIYCVAFATESEARAALNRGGNAKEAVQRGTTPPQPIGILAPAPYAPYSKFAFNTWTPDGVCMVPCEGAPADGGLVWTLEQIAGSTQASAPDPPAGANVTFTYTTLPSGSLEFGDKIPMLTCQTPPLNPSPSTKIRVFFSKTATNHPNEAYGRYPGSTLIAPNWYYYWDQTTAAYGTHYFDRDPRWWRIPTHYEFFEGQWRAAIGDNAATTLTCPPWGNPNGIDLFAWACRHEAEHIENMTEWWGGVGNPRVEALDPDGDNIPTTEEVDLLPIVPGNPDLRYDPDLFLTPGLPNPWGYPPDGWCDSEHWCLTHQEGWQNGTADAEDWAHPGHQWPAQP